MVYFGKILVSTPINKEKEVPKEVPKKEIKDHSEDIFWIQSLSAYFFNSIESHMVSF